MNNTTINMLKDYNNYIIKNSDIEGSKLDQLYEEYIRLNKSSTSKSSTTSNGVIKRPRGRKPKGKIWNEITGQWDDESKELILNDNDYKNYKLSDLKKECIKKGMLDDTLLEIDDSDNPKQLLINYLLKKECNKN